MIDNNYIIELEKRINKLIESAKITYEKLQEKSSNITSYYEWNIEQDDFVEHLMRILFYKKQLYRLKHAEQELDHPPTDEEYSEIRHQRLINDKTMYNEQIDFLNNAIDQIDDTRAMERIKDKLEGEKFRIQTSLGSVNSNLRVYESKPDLTDEEIDIYISESNKSFKGIIYLHNTGIEIGDIEYRHQCDSKWLADIGYNISPSYRGNNYAYKALKLIEPLIAQIGVKSVTITVREDNIASIKTIEKFGGVLTEIVHGDVLSYTCEIKPILKKSKIQKTSKR